MRDIRDPEKVYNDLLKVRQVRPENQRRLSQVQDFAEYFDLPIGYFIESSTTNIKIESMDQFFKAFGKPRDDSGNT